MTAEQQPGGEPTEEDMTRLITFQEGRQLPPGVQPAQLDFLREAARVGAFSWVRVNTAKMIAAYYTTEATYADLAKEYGITKQAVQERISRGMGKMRRVLYRERPELTEEDRYPLAQMKKGKDETEIFKSARHQERRSRASQMRKPPQLP